MVRTFAAAALLSCSAAWAQDATEASVERLLALMQAESMVDSAYAASDRMMRQTMQQAMPPGTGAEQQAAADRMREKMVAAMRSEMSWAVMKPRFVQLYRETFTEAEMLAESRAAPR